MSIYPVVPFGSSFVDVNSGSGVPQRRAIVAPRPTCLYGCSAVERRIRFYDGFATPTECDGVRSVQRPASLCWDDEMNGQLPAAADTTSLAGVVLLFKNSPAKLSAFGTLKYGFI